MIKLTNVKLELNIAAAIFIYCFTFTCESSIQMTGFWFQAPNEFWPVNNFVAYGTVNQQNLPNLNPELFCEMQEGNFRLPSIGEWNASARSYLPLNSQPSHPMSYPDPLGILTEQTRLPNITTKETTGSFFNEWGDLTKYPEGGFPSANLWAAEPANGSQRYAMLSTTGAVTAQNANASFYTVCIQDI